MGGRTWTMLSSDSRVLRAVSVSSIRSTKVPPL